MHRRYRIAGAGCGALVLAGWFALRVAYGAPEPSDTLPDTVLVKCRTTAQAITCPQTRPGSATCTATTAQAVYLGGNGVTSSNAPCIGAVTDCGNMQAWELRIVRGYYCRTASGVVGIRCLCTGE